MTALIWIVASGIAMSLIAFIGMLFFVIKKKNERKILNSLVAFAAGTLLGSAFFHMIPLALSQLEDSLVVFSFVVGGFVVFLGLEQFVHWHHSHNNTGSKVEPVTFLVLIADGLHNFIDGLTVGSVFLLDIRMGVAAWLAVAAHEIPQELGDFAILLRGGWLKKKALWFNFLSGITFLSGGIVVYFASGKFNINTDYIIPFGAGNFIYIGASDLIPQIKKGENMKQNIIHFIFLLTGLLILLLLSLF